MLDRLEGLTDAEFFWEPVPNCWSIRRREDLTASACFGKGEWVYEYDPRQEQPGPLTTLAWRIGHLASGTLLRADYTIGTHTLTWDEYEFPHTAAQGIAALQAARDAWHAVLTTADDAKLDTIGGSSFPWGLDPTLPLLDICWWVNQESLHHGSEIALLRDLYRAMRQ
jgi:hypothetical protein